MEDTFNLGNVLIIVDLIDKLKEKGIPGLLLLVDFEKAFDRCIIEKKLYDFYGFDPILCKKVKQIYTDITSTVSHTGKLSACSTLVREMERLSLVSLSLIYLILVLELLIEALKYDPGVSGVIVNDPHYFLRQGMSSLNCKCLDSSNYPDIVYNVECQFFIINILPIITPSI